MKIWFTSDLHLCHNKIIEYDNRPFNSVEEMDATLIKNWNSVVKSEDLVYILGDFGFSSLPKIREILNQLKGQKVLILGNHDRHTDIQYHNAGFSLVVREIVIRFGKAVFKLSHYPYRQAKWWEWWERLVTGKNYRHINKKRPIRGREDWLLHGHIHSGSVKIDRVKRQIHVGCYLWDYKPVALSQILNLIYNGA
jgi:calcineurin-like phosphoesterase family protein